MKRKVTIVSMNKHEGRKDLLTSPELITFELEEDNEKDPDAIKVLCNGTLAGYIANSTNTVLENTTPASAMKTFIATGAKINPLNIKEETTEGGRWYTYVMEVDMAFKKNREKADGKKGEEISEFSLEGTQALFPERINVFESFTKGGAITLTIKETDRGLEVLNQNGSIGVVKTTQENYKDLVTLVSGASVICDLSKNSTVRSLKVTVNMAEVKTNYDNEIDRIMSEGILTEDKILDRIRYMEKSVKLNELQVRRVLQRIVSVRAEDEARLVDIPKTLFVEYNQYMYESIIFTLKGKFLRYVGGKATGKNTAAETLAWLFNRPVGEVAINEGVDKVDLTGSRIIDSDENGNLKMPYDLSTFARGLQNGWFVVVDEVNTASAALLTIFHGLDSRRRLDIPGYGTIKVHPCAEIILTMNEDYVGTAPLNEATSDRFTPIIFEDAKDIRGMLKAAMPNALDEHVDICQQFYEMLKVLHTDGKISSYPISIRGFIDALDVVEDLGLQRGIGRNVVDKGIDQEERLSLHEQLDLLFS